MAAVHTCGRSSITAGALGYGPHDLAPGQSVHVHVVSQTSKDSCGTVDNTATVSTSNRKSTRLDSSQRGNSYPVSSRKVADAATVSAGDQIGFTITLTNSRALIARNVPVHHPLPYIPCTIRPLPAAPLFPYTTLFRSALGYGPHDLAPGQSVHVHVVSQTSKDSCGTVDNTATVSTAHDGSRHTEASLVVTCAQI